MALRRYNSIVKKYSHNGRYSKEATTEYSAKYSTAQVE